MTLSDLTVLLWPWTTDNTY